MTTNLISLYTLAALIVAFDMHTVWWFGVGALLWWTFVEKVD